MIPTQENPYRMEAAQAHDQRREERWYSARWCRENSRGRLDDNALREAGQAGRVKSRKVSGRWEYELKSVCRAYPDCEGLLRAAAPPVT